VKGIIVLELFIKLGSNPNFFSQRSTQMTNTIRSALAGDNTDQLVAQMVVDNFGRKGFFKKLR
jgi:hypothetical protein